MEESKEVKCLDKGFVRLVDHMGSDARIVQTARVSYGAGTKTVREDTGLINYLMRNDHSSPFEMPVVLLHIKAPIFIARQWMRHRTSSVNEISARYSEMKDEFYHPETWRAQSSTNKQGSFGIIEDQEAAILIEKNITEDAYSRYKDLLDLGASREMARAILPVGLYTEFYWQQNLKNLLHFLNLRMDAHAQQEIRVYANAIFDLIKPLFPISVAAWEEHVRNSVKFSPKEIEVIKAVVEYMQSEDPRILRSIKDKLGLQY
jgi:thymidylate synthase (FAD)